MRNTNAVINNNKTKKKSNFNKLKLRFKNIRLKILNKS